MADRPARHRAGWAEVAAVVLSVAWVIAAGLFLVFAPGAGLQVDRDGFVLTLVAVFLPVAMIWIGVLMGACCPPPRRCRASPSR